MILTNNEHGFRSKRSCETQLVKTIHDLSTTLNNGEQLDSVVLDFSKVFDKVNHRKLCYKLDNYGIRGKTLQWITKYLESRTQKVIISGSVSESIYVKLGVPQGTVLGPLLFLCYINDMPDLVDSNIGLFADDSYIYRDIKSKDDCIELQKDLEKLIQWEKDWSMEFHPKKCKVLTISNKRKTITHQYQMHNTILDKVEQEKYLGVTLLRNYLGNHMFLKLWSKQIQ